MTTRPVVLTVVVGPVVLAVVVGPLEAPAVDEVDLDGPPSPSSYLQVLQMKSICSTSGFGATLTQAMWYHLGHLERSGEHFNWHT